MISCSCSFLNREVNCCGVPALNGPDDPQSVFQRLCACAPPFCTRRAAAADAGPEEADQTVLFLLLGQAAILPGTSEGKQRVEIDLIEVIQPLHSSPGKELLAEDGRRTASGSPASDGILLDSPKWVKPDRLLYKILYKNRPGFSPKMQVVRNKRLVYGGGGGSRTRVRNRCQPGVFMLCPIPFWVRRWHSERTRCARN